MLSIISEYISLALQVAAAVIAISLFKRTKFNVSWILISSGFLLMTLSRVFELWPTIEPERAEQMVVIQRWLDFVISLVLLVGVFYIRKIFLFMRRLDELRSETGKRVLSAVIRTEEQERKRRAAEKEIMLDEETVQHRLGKSRATLWRWNISGYLIRYKVGGKNCYKLSDIERIEGGHKK